MRIAIGVDHAGYPVKEALKAWLSSANHEVLDCGTNSAESTDYPDYAEAVACSVQQGRSECGILICGTGIGMSIAANKIRGIRAAVCHNEFTAEVARTHNHANVLCLGARVLDEAQMRRVIEKFLASGEDGERHARRVAKIAKIEGSCQH